MRTIRIEPLGDPSGEQSLELWIAPIEGAIDAFASAAGVEQPLPSAIPFERWSGAAWARTLLARHASLSLPEPCDWPTHVVSDDWDDRDVVIAGPASIIRYHWWTTA